MRAASRPASGLRPAFTLTELLIVIAIIAVLAGLIAAAAVNAMRAANRGRITLEIKNMSGALEEFKTQFGAYPPNGMIPNTPTGPPPSGTPAAIAMNDFRTMFKKAFPRSNEHPELIDAIAGITPSSTTNVQNGLPNGLSAAEALYFWLGGFSDDPQYPLTGEGGPSFVDTNTAGDEVLESRKFRFEFDLERLSPRDDNGQFTGDRFIEYVDPRNPNVNRQINFWQYRPKGSEQPLVYFDVSRRKPHQHDMWAVNPASGAPYVFAMKQLRSGAVGPVNAEPKYISDVVYVDQGKFQILHAGLDDAWGDEFARVSPSNTAHPNLHGWGTAAFGSTVGEELFLYPDGPFIGEVADTLTSFTDGTLEDAVEE
jgi:prepilin-type N-terminal cleavage/methylation domain-containing protein